MELLEKIKSFYTKINNRVKSAGISAFVWGVIAFMAYLFSFNGLFLISLGIFITRNFDWVTRWVNCYRSGSDETNEDDVERNSESDNG